MGIFHGNRGLDITYEDYPNGYCLYCLDLTPNRSASDSSHANLITEGDVRIELQFTEGFNAALSCVVYAEFDGSLQIDKSRNVFVDHFPLPHPTNVAASVIAASEPVSKRRRLE
jgi:hypothetical protein